MFEGLSYLFSPDRPAVEILRDFADIFIVAFILYRALLVLRGTRAMQMGLGFLAFGGLYLMAKYAELATLMQVLSWLASSAILIVVVVFQNDIRRALIRVGSKAWFSRRQDAQERVIDDVVAAATALARHRTGALICLERDANVLEFITNEGIDIDAHVSKDLLESLFAPHEQVKTHDGAVLIRNLRIARAGVFFPMPKTKITDATLGSRHRAAIAITEETDAVVVVVSEERGVISMVSKEGEMAAELSGETLRERLLQMFGRSPAKTARKLPFRKAAFNASPLTAKSGAEKKEVKGDRRTDSTAPPPRTSNLPPSERPTSPKLADAKKATKQSGGFRAMDRDDEDTEEISAALRLSVPMPSSKDRKSGDDSGVDIEPPPPSAVQVSKPMTPTDLTKRPSHPNDES